MDKNEKIFRILKEDPIGLLSKQIAKKVDERLNAYQVAKICSEDSRITKVPKRGSNGRERWTVNE